MTDLDAVLADRAKTHGDYKVHAQITQSLKAIVRGSEAKRNDSQREALEMILHKIGRICAGDPNIKDHWVDIAGYAQLVANQLDAT